MGEVRGQLPKVTKPFWMKEKLDQRETGSHLCTGDHDSLGDDYIHEPLYTNNIEELLEEQRQIWAPLKISGQSPSATSMPEALIRLNTDIGVCCFGRFLH